MAAKADPGRESILEEAKAAFKTELENQLIAAYKAQKAASLKKPGAHEGWWRLLHPATIVILED